MLGLLAVTMLCSCSHGVRGRLYDSGSKGQTITMERGELVAIRLAVNYTIGAEWRITELDRNVVDMLGEPRYSGNVVAGGLARIYSYTYEFKAVSSGTTQLEMKQFKPGSEEPIESFNVTFIVK